MGAALAWGLAGALPLQAQDLIYRHFERELRERTTIGRERPALQPWIPWPAALRIDSVSGTRIFVGGAEGPGDRAVLVVAPDGRVRSFTRIAESRRSLAARPPMPAEDSLWRARAELIAHHRTIRLPEQRVRWMARQFGPVPIPGAPVTDTLVFDARHAEFADSVRFVRTRVTVRDTVVEGRRLVVVRDSAHVIEWATWPMRLRSMGADEIRVRTLAGTLRGASLMDPVLGVVVTAHDTIRLEGELRVALPDGRAFTTPVVVERIGRVTSHTPGAWAALQAARTPTYEGGMVHVPDSAELARRAATREMGTDALVALWVDAPDFAARAEVFRRIRSAFPDPQMAEWNTRLRSAALAAGDTAGALELALGMGGTIVPVDTGFWSLVRPFLDDPGHALDFDVSVEEFYDAVIAGFLHGPPAVAAGRPGVPCELEACSRMAAAAGDATDARLRDFGLVARVALSADPADARRVLERAAAGSAMAARIEPLIRGAASTWTVGERPPVPEPGADWRDWLTWSGARPPVPAIEQWFVQRGVAFEEPFRFDPSHANVLHFHSRLTGRDYVTEFTRALETATSDSARLVYGTMRIGLGAPPPAPEIIAGHVLADTPAVRALGRVELRAFFESTAEPASQETAALAMHGLLSMLLEDGEPWT